MNPTVVLLEGGTGAGHRVAAQAVESELGATGFTVHRVDTSAFLLPPTRWAYFSLHLNLLEYAPALYGPLYERGSRSTILKRAHERLAVASRARFRRALEPLKPDVVFSTFALGCALAAPLRRAAGFRLAALTTDYRAHAFQIHRDVDLYCASHPWAASDLTAAGVAAERIAVTGIPLRDQFDAPPDRRSARAALELPADQPVVLVARGGMTAGHETVALLKALLAAPELTHCHIVAILGSRARSLPLVTRAIPPNPRLHVVSFVEAMATYLAAADVIVGKAGGLSSTEVFTVGRPLVLYAPNAGIETANVERFCAAGAVLNAGRSPATVVAVVHALLTQPERRAALVAAGATLVRKESRQAVRQALERLLAPATVPQQTPAPASAQTPG